MMLSVSRRTIINYVKRGILSRVLRNGQAFVPADQVALLSNHRMARDAHPENKRIRMLEARIAKMEREMYVVKQHFDVQPSTFFDGDDKSVLALYAHAEDTLKQESLVDGQAALWCSTMKVLDEKFFIALERLKGKKAWRVFRALAGRIQEIPGFEVDGEDARLAVSRAVTIAMD